MTEYYKHEEFLSAKKQKRLVLIIFYAFLALFLAYCTWAVIYYIMLPYHAPQQTTVKIVTCAVSAVFVIVTYIYFATVYRYAKLRYKMTVGIENGLTETMVGTFIDYFSEPETKNGIECKSMRFEVSSIKNDEINMERKVLIPYTKEYPEFNKGDTVTFVTHANILVAYEVENKVKKWNSKPRKTKKGQDDKPKQGEQQ